MKRFRDHLAEANQEAEVHWTKILDQIPVDEKEQKRLARKREEAKNKKRKSQ